MTRFFIFFPALLFCITQPIIAQETVSIEATITDVRPHDQVRGFFIDPADPVAFIEIAPTTLESPGTRIFDTDRSQRLSLNELQSGTRVLITGAFDGPRFIASEVVVLQRVQHIWLDGIVTEIVREGSSSGQIILDSFYVEHVDRRAPIYIDGVEVGTGPHPVIDLLNRTTEPAVVSVSERNHFEHNGHFGRVDIATNTSQPVRTENEHTISFQLPANVDDAIYVYSEGKFALRQIRSVIPVTPETFFSDEALGIDDISFGEVPLHARITVNAQIAGNDFISAHINVANRPQEIRATFDINGHDPGNRSVHLGAGSSKQMNPSARYFDHDGNPVSIQDFADRQWERYPSVAVLTIDPLSGQGTEARLIEWHPEITVGSDQIMLGAIGQIHRGFWANTHNPEMATRDLFGIFIDDIALRTSTGEPVSQSQLDWGARVEVEGLVIRDELIIREVTFQNLVRSFDITTRLNAIDLDNPWMTFESAAPYQAARDIQVIDHFGDPNSLHLITDLLEQVDLQLRLTFGTNSDNGTRVVTKLEAFRPGEEVQLDTNQELIQGARIRPWDDPALIFPQSIEHANFNSQMEVIDETGTPVDPRALTVGLPIRAKGWVIQKNHNGQIERLVRVSRIEILGGQITQYRGTLANVANGTLAFETPQPITIKSHTDLREETGFQTDFLTLAARIRSEGGLRLHFGADFDRADNPEMWWARILRADEQGPSFLNAQEQVAIFVDADEINRTLHLAPLPEIATDSETVVVGPGGEPNTLEDLTPSSRLVVLAEDSGGQLIAREIRIEAAPRAFTVTAELQDIDPESRIVRFHAPDIFTVTDDVQIHDAAGNTIELDQLGRYMIDNDLQILRITQTPDSPNDSPIVTRIEVLSDVTSTLDADEYQLIVGVDDPGYRIRPNERIIEPTSVPAMVVSNSAEIRDAAGNAIDLSTLSNNVRVRIAGHDIGDRITVSEIQILGPRTETGEGTIAAIDVSTRTLTPAPEEPLSLTRNTAYFGPDGRTLGMLNFAEILSQNPDLVLIVSFHGFESGVSSLRLANEQDVHHQPNPGEQYYRANEVTIDPESSQLTFQAFPPVHVQDNALITGPNSETFTLADLEAGMRIFVRGFNPGDSDQDFIITAIFVRPSLNTIHLMPQVVDADGDGVENDVRVDIRNQDDVMLNERIRLHVDFHSSRDVQNGHIIRNLQPGPHIIGVELADRPAFAEQVRVFISARGTAFQVAETYPSANATGVSTMTDISVTFNEPLHRVGDFYIAVEGQLSPAPVSGRQPENPEIVDEGRTIVFRDVDLAENTDYTIHIFSATSRSGNSLAQAFRSRFSTSSSLTQPSALSGVITLTETVRFVGTARLFDANNEPVAETALTESGSFSFNDLSAGTYRVYIEIQSEDGRTTGDFWDDNNDSLPDDIILASGESRGDLFATLELPEAVIPNETGVNAEAIIAIDLNRNPQNQNEHSQGVLPENEFQVAVYAQNVTDLIGYNISLSYDPDVVAFLSADDTAENEINLLRQNGGLAVNIPPVVTTGSIEYAGAILGATSNQVATGNGLLGVFYFRTLRTFESNTDIVIPRVVLQSRNAADVIPAGINATLRPAEARLVMRLSATPETIPADGDTPAIIRAQIVDALGQTIGNDVPVRFGIVSGVGTLSHTEVTPTDGIAETELKGVEAGDLVISVTAGDITEQITITLNPVRDTNPTGPVGPIALDFDTATGDQAKRQIAAPAVGATFEVDVVATQIASGLLGYQIKFEFDETQVAFDSFATTDIFEGAAPITFGSGGNITVSSAFLGGGPTTQESGSIGTATFKMQSGFSGETHIVLTSAETSSGSEQRMLDIGVGTTITIGGDAPAATGPDFDGDGSVGFTDFLSFAQVFGTTQNDEGYNARFDLNSNGEIGFGDFIIFAQAFGQSAKPARASKVLGQSINNHTGLNIQTISSNTDNTVELVVQLTDAGAVQGYGFEINYDSSALVFTDVNSAHPSQFATLTAKRGEGTLLVSDILRNNVQGNEDLVRLTFQVIDPTAVSQIDIADALISDPSGRMDNLGTHMTDVRILPTAYELGQNHPNPFNPETVVPFALPQTGDIRLAIYNMLGQEVRVLANEVREAGHHRIIWDGKDALGRSIASGIYFVRLQSSTFSSVRKMTLLK